MPRLLLSIFRLTASVLLLLSFGCASSDGSDENFAVDTTMSTLEVEPMDELLADGEQSALVTVTTRNFKGEPLPGLSVSLAANSTGAFWKNG